MFNCDKFYGRKLFGKKFTIKSPGPRMFQQR